MKVQGMVRAQALLVVYCGTAYVYESENGKPLTHLVLTSNVYILECLF
jgi:hypothetical protein